MVGPFEDRVVSVVCNDEGQIVYVNILSILQYCGKIMFRPMQQGSKIFAIEYNSGVSVPAGVAYVTLDNQIVKEGYCYLGRWKSMYTYNDKALHHVANALGDIKVFTDAELDAFAQKNRLTYLDYKEYEDYGDFRTAEEIPVISDSKRYAKEDFGHKDVAWLNLLNVELKSGSGRSCYSDSRYIEHSRQGAVLTAIKFNDPSSTVFMIPESIANPWVYLQHRQQPLSLCYPRAVHSFGLSVAKECISINFPEEVYRDVFIALYSVEVQQKEWVVPIHTNTYIDLSGVSGLKTLRLKLVGEMSNVSNSLFLRIKDCEIDNVFIDYDEPWVLFFWCDKTVKQVTIHSPITNKTWTKKVIPYQDPGFPDPVVWSDLVSCFIDVKGVYANKNLVIGVDATLALPEFGGDIIPHFSPYDDL